MSRFDTHEIIDGLTDKPARGITSFGWALDREIIEANPMASLPRPKTRVRERALTDAEIPVAWRVTEEVGYPFGPLVRLLMLTACRRGKIAGLRWWEIDLDQGIITIPSVRYKTGLALVVPLSTMARKLIDDLPRHAGGDFSCSRREAVGSRSAAIRR